LILSNKTKHFRIDRHVTYSPWGVTISYQNKFTSSGPRHCFIFIGLYSITVSEFRWQQCWQPFYSKIVYFLASNATPSILRLGRTPRTSGPEIKSKKYDGYQHNLTSHPMAKRRKQSMSPRVNTVHYQLSISQKTENLAIATLHQQREIKESSYMFRSTENKFESLICFHVNVTAVYGSKIKVSNDLWP
jgi:hypothetical protein